MLVDAACELALTPSQMRKFVVPKTSTVKVDTEQARMERAAVMAAKAGVANSLGLSWPPSLKKRVGRPSRRDLYVDSVHRHIDEHASVPADFTVDVPVWWVRGMGIARTEADADKAHSENFEVTASPPEPHPDVTAWFMGYAQGILEGERAQADFAHVSSRSHLRDPDFDFREGMAASPCPN